MPILDPGTPADVQMIRDLMGAAADGLDDAALINDALLAVTWAQMIARYPQLAGETDPDRVQTIKLAQALLLAARVAETEAGATGGTMRLGDMTISGGSWSGSVVGWTNEAWALLAGLYPTERSGGFVGFGLSHGRRGGGSGTRVEATDRERGWPW